MLTEHNILDIGCFNYKIPNSIGIDILKNTKADIRASVYYLPFNNKFDIIYLREVLEYLENPYQALVIIRGSLKNDGYLIMTVPNMLSIDCMLRFGVFGKLTASEEHIYSWTIAELRNILPKAGFDIIEIGYTTPEQYYKKGKLMRIFSSIPRLSEKSIIIKAKPKEE